MPSNGSNATPGLGGAVKQVSDHAVGIVRLEAQLAKLELSRKLKSMGLAAGLGAAAGIFALFALGFGLAAGASGIAAALPMWAALLIVAGGVLLLALILAGAARAAAKRGSPPVPERAIAEAKETRAALQEANGR